MNATTLYPLEVTEAISVQKVYAAIKKAGFHTGGQYAYGAWHGKAIDRTGNYAWTFKGIVRTPAEAVRLEMHCGTWTHLSTKRAEKLPLLVQALNDLGFTAVTDGYDIYVSK
jgi:hypothetical protein